MSGQLRDREGRVEGRPDDEVAGNKPADEELAVRAREGDERAFRELYRRHAPSLAGRLWRIFGRREDVHDALQATFLQLHRSLRRYDARRPFGPWLHRICYRATGTILRTRRRKKWLSFWASEKVEQIQGRGASAEQRAVTNQLVRRLYAAMDRLPEKKRIAFALCELQGLSQTEVGELVGASPQTVWARVQSARKLLQEELTRSPETSGGQSAERGSSYE